MANGKIFLRAGFPFNYDTNAAGDASGLDCSVDGPGRTKQSMKDEVDINNIARKYGLTGMLAQVAERPPMYGTFEGVFDFQTAMNAVRAAQESFDSLPPDVRERFMNDPQRLLEFAEKADEAELVKLGFVERKPVEPAPPAAPAGAPGPASGPAGASAGGS